MSNGGVKDLADGRFEGCEPQETITLGTDILQAGWEDIAKILSREEGTADFDDYSGRRTILLP